MKVNSNTSTIEGSPITMDCEDLVIGPFSGVLVNLFTRLIQEVFLVWQDIIEAESKLFVQTYARSPVVFVSGEGCKLYDTEDKEYLDLTAGIAVNALGHGDPAWVKAVSEQAGKLAHVSNLFHTVPQVYTSTSTLYTF